MRPLRGPAGLPLFDSSLARPEPRFNHSEPAHPSAGLQISLLGSSHLRLSMGFDWHMFCMHITGRLSTFCKFVRQRFPLRWQWNPAFQLEKLEYLWLLQPGPCGWTNQVDLGTLRLSALIACLNIRLSGANLPLLSESPDVPLHSSALPQRRTGACFKTPPSSPDLSQGSL